MSTIPSRQHACVVLPNLHERDPPQTFLFISNNPLMAFVLLPPRVAV
jgi:hypothetical protein